MFTFINGIGIADVFVHEVCVGLDVFQLGWELLCLAVFAKAPKWDEISSVHILFFSHLRVCLRNV
jgi:hypothetical protein